MRLGAFIILALLLVSSVSAANYVRWNNLLDECVYYYDKEDARAHCFVAQEHCTYRRYFNEPKTIDEHACYYIPINEPPVLEVLGAEAYEGDVITLEPSCTDDEHVIITYSGRMAGGSWRTTYTDAGIHQFTVTCTDNRGATDAEDVTIIVHEKNRPPLFTAMQ